MVTLQQVLDLVSKFAIVGGGLWLVWGVIVLAGGLKDKNGPALQSGIWQIVGGGLIIAAAAFLRRLPRRKTAADRRSANKRAARSRPLIF